MRKSRYEPGTANAVSDRSGFVYKRNQMRKEWTGILVGIDEWEPKQPQLTIRPVPDRQYTPDPRPENILDETLGPIITSSEYV